MVEFFRGYASSNGDEIELAACSRTAVFVGY